MSVTVHYITLEWEMKHDCLQTREVDERHTVKNLAEELRMVLRECGLENARMWPKVVLQITLPT